jgi:hypothetical protein
MFDEVSFSATAVAQRKPFDVMTEPGQFERQLPKPAEVIVDQILRHILPFSENENTQGERPQ